MAKTGSFQGSFEETTDHGAIAALMVYRVSGRPAREAARDRDCAGSMQAHALGTYRRSRAATGAWIRADSAHIDLDSGCPRRGLARDAFVAQQVTASELSTLPLQQEHQNPLTEQAGAHPGESR